MIDIEKWLKIFSFELNKRFGERIKFLGIQGSYSRGEADEDSDIDVVVIFDKLDIKDIKEYNTIISGLEFRDRICGFVSGESELMNWDRADLFQFYFDTVPVAGNLDCLKPFIDGKAAAKAVHTGVCNIYHACVHNILHDKDVNILKSLYKSASFAVQALHYVRTGKYIRKKNRLIEELPDMERRLIKNYLEIRRAESIDKKEFERLSEFIFQWSQEIINSFK